MKTTFYLLAILVLFIQGMLIAQEPNKKVSDKTKQPLLIPTNKVDYSSEARKENRKNTKAPVDAISTTKTTSDLDNKINLIDKQIAELEKLKNGLTEEAISSTESAFKSSETKSLLLVQMDLFFDLEEETRALGEKYVALKKQAISKTGNERVKVVKEAEMAYSAYETKQIELSNALAQINYNRFKENKSTIKVMLVDYHGGAIYVKLVNRLTDEADYAMRMAVEIREEANAQGSNAVILANYSNAEEKEVVALNKQEEAIDVLEKTAFIYFIHMADNLALNFIELNLEY